jgi:hypothetical protein
VKRDTYRRARRLTRRGPLVWLVKGNPLDPPSCRIYDEEGQEFSAAMPATAGPKIARALRHGRPVLVHLFALGRRGRPHLDDTRRQVARRLELVRFVSSQRTANGSHARR